MLTLEQKIAETIEQAEQLKECYCTNDAISINVTKLAKAYGEKTIVGFNFRKNVAVGDKWKNDDGSTSECVAIV